MTTTSLDDSNVYLLTDGTNPEPVGLGRWNRTPKRVSETRLLTTGSTPPLPSRAPAGKTTKAAKRPSTTKLLTTGKLTPKLVTQKTKKQRRRGRTRLLASS